MACPDCGSGSYQETGTAGLWKCINCHTTYFAPMKEPAMSNDTLKMQVGGDHYMSHGKMQPWVIIDHYNLNFWEASALSYILRSKDPAKRAEDLRKAAHYLEHQAQRVEAGK